MKAKHFILLILFLFSKLIYADGFIEGTTVASIENTNLIENISIGDKVLSCEFSTKKCIETQVNGIKKDYSCNLVLLQTFGDELIVDGNQRFYSRELGDWIEAKNLKSGQTILNANNEDIEVISQENLNNCANVLDLSINDENHNFFVGKNHLITHNFVFVIPILTVAFGAGGIAVIAPAIATIATGIGVAIVANEISNSNRAPVTDQSNSRGSSSSQSPQNDDEGKESKGKNANKLKPDPLATGDHITFKYEKDGAAIPMEI